MVIKVDLDEDVVRQAAAELGTVTEEDTVRAAVVLVAGRRARLEAMFDDPFALGTGPDIGDDQLMQGARR